MELVYGWEDFTSSEDRTRSARSVGQRLTHWATGAPRYLQHWYLKVPFYIKECSSDTVPIFIYISTPVLSKQTNDSSK